ncbi:serine acetyltransferase [Flavobacterium sp. J49]|uniref:serine O-acetyltransferase n=1 Tax=Flavobacterium sp. J49 TaxID=2718534 RepID=UPI00159371F3|nr:serine acetyltransferase [Flavobacterium sp. J49]MBF6640020.1 serine acetyltransferase [Flavobacterium sp. J49]NIC01265.1 serine acetyltransferase [Flavobacterium sp. J49]
MPQKVIHNDLKRFGNTNRLLCFFTNPMFRYMVIFRANQRVKKYHPLFFPLRVWYKNISRKYGIQIPVLTKIGGGFLINHYGGIVVNQGVKIGTNCNISQGVTLGNVSRGKLKGCPQIGDRVWIGANSVVVGKITIGNDVLIAPLSYVNFDVPDKAVVMGNPAQIVNYNTSAVYIKNAN